MQACSFFPKDRNLIKIRADIRKAVADRFGITPDVLDASEHNNHLHWPDYGMVRREHYPWNDFEPSRLDQLPILNAMMAEVAPKLEVKVVTLKALDCGSSTTAVDAVRQLGVFAKADIEPGEVLLDESSMLTANNKLLDALCDACSADLPGLAPDVSSRTVSCPDCEAVFCSDECYKKAMEMYHPALCDMGVEAIARDVPPAEAADSLYCLLLLRALAMAETQQCHPLDLKEVKYIWGDFRHQSVPSNLRNSRPEDLPRTLPFSFENNIRLPFHMLEKMNIDIFADGWKYDVWVFNTLYAKFRGTASARLSGLGGRAIRGPEVSAVHSMWCLANHSCDPNVRWEWGGTIKFWASDERVAWERDGQKNRRSGAGIKQGEEVLNHYCDIELPVEERREWAKGALGGRCRCARCLWEAGEGG